MAEHTITLSDADEAALAWAARRAGGRSVDAVLREWIDRGLATAAGDLNATLSGLTAAGVQPEERDRIQRMLVGQAEPAPIPEPEPASEPPVNVPRVGVGKRGA
jgi:hypothetical protein